MAAPDHLRPDASGAAPAGDLQRLRAANDAAVTFYRGQLTAHDGPRRYLDQRGLGVLADREWPWRVGYAPPGWSTLTRHLQAAGFTADELLTAGLSARTRDGGRLIDVFRDRVVFPIRDPAGHTVGFIGRASPASMREHPDTPKYLNTRATPLYDKDQLLFGMAEQRDRLAAGWTPVLVEGPADALAVWLSYARTGTTGAVALAPCGTAFSTAQADLLTRLPGARQAVVVGFDGDRAGHAAAEHALARLREHSPAGRLLAAEFAADADPADLLARPNGRAQLRAALQRQARPLTVAVVDHHLQRLVDRHPRLLDDIAGRHAAAAALAPRVFAAADPQEAARLGQHIATRTGTGLNVVLTAAVEHLEGVVSAIPDPVSSSSPVTAPRPAPSPATRPPPAAASAFPRLQPQAPGTTAAPQLPPGTGLDRGSARRHR